MNVRQAELGPTDPFFTPICIPFLSIVHLVIPLAFGGGKSDMVSAATGSSPPAQRIRGFFKREASDYYSVKYGIVTFEIRDFSPIRTPAQQLVNI